LTVDIRPPDSNVRRLLFAREAQAQAAASFDAVKALHLQQKWYRPT